MKKKSVMNLAAPVVVLCGLLASAALAADDETDIKCTNRTLLGSYGFHIEGVGGLPPGVPINAIRGVAMGNFDGKGNYTQVDHVVAGGSVPPVEWIFGSGPYKVNPNCTGTLTINVPGSPFSPVKLFFVVVRQGKEIRTVVDSPSASTSIGVKVE
jgi:hypothetical protein